MTRVLGTVASWLVPRTTAVVIEQQLVGRRGFAYLINTFISE